MNDACASVRVSAREIDVKAVRLESPESNFHNGSCHASIKNTIILVAVKYKQTDRGQILVILLINEFSIPLWKRGGLQAGIERILNIISRCSHPMRTWRHEVLKGRKHPPYTLRSRTLMSDNFRNRRLCASGSWLDSELLSPNF